MPILSGKWKKLIDSAEYRQFLLVTTIPNEWETTNPCLYQQAVECNGTPDKKTNSEQNPTRRKDYCSDILTQKTTVN